MDLSNYPPGFSGRSEERGLVPQTCANGHVWHASMYAALGGMFYHNDADACCPDCGEEDLNDPDLAEKRARQR